jgi:RNA polymerase sigma-70 factor (ECF subfamily)
MEDDLTRLYRMYGPAIYARCRSLLQDAAEAEDATQETFTRVHRHLTRLPPGREALYWIQRVATNYCLNELRNRRGRPSPGAIPRDEAPVARQPEERICDRDLVLRLLDGSSDKLRAVAWLYHVDGFEQEEVARILGLSRRTVATRLTRFLECARKFLRRAAS